MCGIFIAVSKKEAQIDLKKCRLSLEEMTHRGPDFQFDSLQFNGRLFMGQNILSITGHPDKELKKYQVSKNNRFNLVLNGEIYNYKDLAKKYLKNIDFETQTDSEVLVNLYEKLSPREIASEIDGMYSYCVYDRNKNALYISRDLVGEKVLYRYEDENHILFASETSTILKFIGDNKLNFETIHKYFHSRHLLANEFTEFKNILVFPVGKTLQISLKSFKQKDIHSETLKDLVSSNKYHRLSNMKESEILEEFDHICKQTAKKLAPKIPYASVFSGGVDSSLASWYMMQEKNKPALLVGLGFDKKDNVSSKLELFSNKVGKEILLFDVSESLYLEAIKKFYKEYITIMPTHSFASQMILSKVIRDKNCKVLIGGDGADELFGGYEFYKNFKSLASDLKFNISPYSGFVESELYFKNFKKENLRKLMKNQWDEALKIFSHIQDSSERVQQAALFLDSFIQMETVGLRSSDLMSMANSVESRSFFVTREMLEFSINLPIKYKINFDEKNPLFITKPLLKKTFVKFFGEELLFEKQGYSGYPNESARKILHGDYFKVRKILNSIDNLRLENNTSLEWKIMNVELFLRSFNMR